MVALADSNRLKEINAELLPRVRAGNLNARDEMVRNNMGLVVAITGRVAKSSQANGRIRDDLTEAGLTALVKGVDAIAKTTGRMSVSAYLGKAIDNDAKTVAENLGTVVPRRTRQEDKRRGKTRRAPKRTAWNERLLRKDRRHNGRHYKPVLVDHSNQGSPVWVVLEELMACCHNDAERLLIQKLADGHEMPEAAKLLGKPERTTYRMRARVRARYLARNQ